MTDDLPSILFVCVHNAGRSQMAAGFATALGGGRVEVLSGGSEPADRINPAAVAAPTPVATSVTSATPPMVIRSAG